VLKGLLAVDPKTVDHDENDDDQDPRSTA
jgi:hypothetical protein